MTKRELNKLPAGGLEAGVLHRMGVQEIINVALHCFTEWKDEQFMRAFYKLELKKLNTIHQKTLAANKEFFEENQRLDKECEQWAKSHKFWREDAHAQGMAYSSLAFNMIKLADDNDRLRTENQRLKQQLAARTVSTDFYPGQFFTYYPN